MQNAPAAQSAFVQIGLKVEETYTTNANLSPSPLAQNDWITELVPSLVARSVGSRLQLNANITLDAFDYLHRSQASSVLPSGGLDARLEAVKDHLFVDAGVVATPAPISLAAPTPQAGSSFNTYTAYNYRLSPDFKGELPAGVRYDVRSDNAWTRASGNQAENVNAYFAHDSAELSSLPRPFGWVLRLEQIETHFDDPTAPSTREQLGRLILRAKVDPQLVVGLRGGRERENYILNNAGYWMRGAEFDWRPTDRSDISASAEKRVFGTSFNYSLTHHNPWLALSLTGSRDIETAPQQLFTLPATGNVAALLDAMLTTQYPDPVGRAQAVQNLIASQNLPAALAGPATIFAPTAYLSTTQQASAVWTGQRSSLALSLFDVHTQSIPADLTQIAVPGTLVTDNVSRGASINLTRHISPFTTFGANATATKIEGTGAQTGTTAKQDALTLQVNRALSTRTGVLAGARYQYFNSGTAEDVREKAAFVALNHRF